MTTNYIKGQDFEILNELPQMGQIEVANSPTGVPTVGGHDWLILDFGQKSKGDLVELGFLFKSEKYKITSTSASCGCTNPTFQSTPDGYQFVNVKFDSSRVTKNVSKWVTLYMDGTTKQKIKINLIINK